MATAVEEVLARLTSVETQLAAVTAQLTVATEASAALRQQTTMLMASHETSHRELEELRKRTSGHGRRLVDPKSLTPERFGKDHGPQWRSWSYMARDYISIFDFNLKKVLGQVELSKEPIGADQTEAWNTTEEADRELAHFLVARTEGEALELVRGAEEQGCHWPRDVAGVGPTL